MFGLVSERLLRISCKDGSVLIHAFIHLSNHEAGIFRNFLSCRPCASFWGSRGKAVLTLRQLMAQQAGQRGNAMVAELWELRGCPGDGPPGDVRLRDLSLNKQSLAGAGGRACRGAEARSWEEGRL